MTWSLFAVKRKQLYVLMFCANITLYSIALLIGVITTGGHPSDISCTTPSTQAKQHDTDHYCPWQGAFLHVFSLSACMWWR